MDEDDDEDELLQLEVQQREAPPPWLMAVRALLASVGEDYPYGSPERALEKFREVLALAPAPPRRRAMAGLWAGGDVDFAAWAGWVCIDMLGRSGPALDEYLVLVENKAPATHQRILERMEAVRADVEATRRLSVAHAALDQALEGGRVEMVTVDELVAAAENAGAWWELRDVGALLSRRGHGDAAWRALSAALGLITRTERGNLASVYEVMGDACKRDSLHATAAEMYLLACVHGGLPVRKRASDQVRVSLKKAGLAKDAEAIRDQLVAGLGERRTRDLLLELRGHLARAGRG